MGDMTEIFSPTQLIGAFFLAYLIGQIARKAKSLDSGGAWAATVVGGLIFGLGGFPWAALLLTFFISSSLLSRLFLARKADLADTFEKGSQRDWGQVLANSGVGTFLVIVQLLYPDQIWPWLGCAAAFAAVNGDTWATELGVLAKTQPRMITTGKPVERGTSGGVTWTGSLAALAGAALVGLVAWAFRPEVGFALTIGSVAVAGLLGTFVDSFLGATAQAIYFDEARQKETERQPTEDTEPIRGWAWMNNDIVNFIASVVGAAAAGLYSFLVV